MARRRSALQHAREERRVANKKAFGIDRTTNPWSDSQSRVTITTAAWTMARKSYR
ncbi:MAG: hypothetical protein ABIR79_03600 [Candidatus Binatia bacterium]